MRKLLSILIIFTLLFTLVPSDMAFAQRASDPTKEADAQAFDDYEQGEVTSPITVRQFEHSKLVTYSCWLGDVNSCTNDPVLLNPSNPNGYYQNSIMGQVSGAMAALYMNKPADTQMYLADLGARAGIIKPAYAQGIGFAGLSPMLDLWKAFRNVAYGFLILVMVLIGFLVLFRMKIDPRTVISIQNALPRVVVTLILITFSYAIVGLMIDLMYVMIFLIMATLKATLGDPYLKEMGTAVDFYTSGSIGELFSAVYTPGMSAVNDIMKIIGGTLVDAVGTLVFAVLGVKLLGPFIPLGPFSGIAGGAAAVGGAALSGGPGNALVSLIVMLAILFTFIRLLFTLISAYIYVIINLIFGPLQIMFGAIPNTNAAGSWFKNLIANLSVFIITSAGLLLAQIITHLASSATDPLWSPPGLSSDRLSSGIAGIIALGMVFMIPTIANSVKELLKTRGLFPAGPGAVFAPVTGTFGTAQSLLASMYYFRGAPNPAGWAGDKIRGGMDAITGQRGGTK